jgi:hypothetical protein
VNPKSLTHAEVLLFVNQTITVGGDAPSNTASTVRVTLDKIDDRWLVSQFDPVWIRDGCTQSAASRHRLRRDGNPIPIMSRTVPVAAVAAAVTFAMPCAYADENNTLVPNNKRLNDAVVANVYAVQHQAGCTSGVTVDPQLQLAAQWHTNDVLNNRTLQGDLGSDGSTPQTRALAAGYPGDGA